MNDNIKEEECLLEPKPYNYVHQQIIRNVHHFYISSIIEEAAKYTDMIFKIQTAGPDDIIYFHLNTGGGYLDSGVQIINAIKSTQGHVIAALEGEVASLGTLLFLAADEFIVHDNSSMMIHNYTGGVYGKGHEQIAALESATTWSKDFMRRIYSPFLNEVELEGVVNGQDLYLHPPEIRDRLVNMVKILDEQAAKKEAEEAEEVEESITKESTPKKKATKKKATKKKPPAKKS